MITEENLNKLYQGIIEGKILTTEELNNYGFNSDDIQKLIENKTIKTITSEEYEFIDSSMLYILGKYHLSIKDYKKSTLYFKKSYELNNSNIFALYQLFIQSIKDKDYEQTLKYYKILDNTKNPYDKPNHRLYLYLLNIIIELPPKLQEYAKNLKTEDILLLPDDKRCKDALAEEKIRKTIINKNFKHALKQLNNLTTKSQINTIQNVILRILIVEVIEAETKHKENILQLCKNNNYEEIINYLKEKEQRQYLSIVEKYIIKLSETILNIKQNKEIPTPNYDITDNVYEAIQRNNYELALELSENYSKKYDLDFSDNTIYILLIEINNLKNNIEKENIKLRDIESCLIKNDISKSIRLIKEYLIQNNKKEYEFLILNLIKISILEKDTTYSNVIQVLTNINNYQFDISPYIESLHSLVSQNKTDAAKVYIDIINNIKKIEQNIFIPEDIEKILEEALKTENTIKSQEKNDEFSKSEIEFVESKYQKLVNEKGIILLKPMHKVRRQRLYKLLENYKDIASFSIGSSEYKQVVLRYKPYIKDRIDFKKLIKEGNDAYHNQNYDECINCYLQIISFGKPKTVAYAMLGLAYMRKFDKNKAIEYLTVATYLSKENNESFDFTELIDKLNGNNQEEFTPKVTMKEDDFQNDLDEHYDVKNFEEINNLILDTGLDVDSACERLNISEENKIRIKLLYAKLYYSYGEYQIGDSFIDDITKIKNKSQFVKKELEEIRKNKKFYINREKTIEHKLSLTLKPKK